MRNHQLRLLPMATLVVSIYAEPLQWNRYEEIIDEQFQISCINSGIPFNDDESCKLNKDPIRVHILDVSGVYAPEVFVATLRDNVLCSEVAMVMVSVTTNDVDCELFESIGSALADADATISAVLVRKSSGVSAEHLSKIFRISHEDAAMTIVVISQLNRQDAHLSLARNFGV